MDVAPGLGPSTAGSSAWRWVSKSGKQVSQSGNKSPKQLFATPWGRPAPSLSCPCTRPVPGQQGGGTWVYLRGSGPHTCPCCRCVDGGADMGATSNPRMAMESARAGLCPVYGTAQGSHRARHRAVGFPGVAP